ncbi:MULTISPECIES: thiosulfate oxidation carrier protein SoxY [Methylotenera]|uniref:thiosulfate oxidation carrier protein SoxY n=1 Tax=Methylotenera TaxID=359407 RepID=UPI00037DC00C|nr:MULTISPECIES: thiosulfate oxidation carrier protein SoxY [Methylotenera]
MQRRDFLSVFLGLVTLLITPINALAATWNKRAFEATKFSNAASDLAISNELPSNDIDINAPDRAENGAIVQLEINSRIPNTESIAIFVEHNPTTLIGHFTFSNGALPKLVTRIKMAETSDVKIVVKAGDQYFTASKNVVVLENGCG